MAINSKFQFPEASDGTPMGCTDGSAPEATTEHELSCLRDSLHILEKTQGTEAAMKVWKAFPYQTQMEMVYSKWTYRAPKR